MVLVGQGTQVETKELLSRIGLLLLHVGSGNQTEVIRLGGKYLYLLSHLTGSLEAPFSKPGMKLNSEPLLSGQCLSDCATLNTRERNSAYVKSSWWRAPRNVWQALKWWQWKRYSRDPPKTSRERWVASGVALTGGTCVRIPVASPYPACDCQTPPVCHQTIQPQQLSCSRRTVHTDSLSTREPFRLQRVHENDPNSNESETFIPLLKWPCGAGVKRDGTAQMQRPKQNGLPGKQSSREVSWDSPTRTSEATLMRWFSSVVDRPPCLPHWPNPSWNCTRVSWQTLVTQSKG